MDMLHEALVYLLAAVVAVPLSRKLGLGSVLGYLAAGVVIGPSATGLVSDVEGVLHFAEFGVVLFLFLVGLELQPSRLWELRNSVFVLGGAQVALTSALFAVLGIALGLKPAEALIAGVGLSLSSTAFALQLLSEKNLMTTDFGRASFGILLFQDLAVIPVLALLPVLGEGPASEGGPMWLTALKVVGVLAGVVFGGRYLLRWVFRVVAASHSHDVFTATALLTVLGTALLVSKVGLSMALGAFLAGVLLADSEYRHELEADIEPFKGLLLGLFFLAVGMSLQLDLLLHKPLLVVGLVLALVALKALVLWGMGRRAFATNHSALSMAVSISQGGEFAFVLFGLAVGFRIMSRDLSNLLSLVVGLSMAVTPFAFAAFERLTSRAKKAGDGRDFDVAPEGEPPVIIAGFGRVGQVVGRVLRAKKIPFTAMDASAEHIDFIKKFGNKVFYGDASRLDLLRAAHADKAKVFVLAIDDVEASLRTAEAVKKHFPNLRIFARARNRQHAYRLLDMGITDLMRETFSSSLEMTGDVLQALGMTFSDAREAMDRFREYDEKMLRENYKYMNDAEKLREMASRTREELEQIFAKDAAQQKAG